MTAGLPLDTDIANRATRRLRPDPREGRPQRRSRRPLLAAWAIGGILAVSVVAGLVYRQVASSSTNVPAQSQGRVPSIVPERVRGGEPVRIVVPERVREGEPVAIIVPERVRGGEPVRIIAPEPVLCRMVVPDRIGALDGAPVGQPVLLSESVRPVRRSSPSSSASRRRPDSVREHVVGQPVAVSVREPVARPEPVRQPVLFPEPVRQPVAVRVDAQPHFRPCCPCRYNAAPRRASLSRSS